MKSPARPLPHSASRGSALFFHCFGRAVTAAGALPSAGGLFISIRSYLEAVRTVRPDVLRDASGRIFGGRTWLI